MSIQESDNDKVENKKGCNKSVEKNSSKAVWCKEFKREHVGKGLFSKDLAYMQVMLVHW